MDFGKSFSFVFEDKDWLKKIALAALIGLIPFIGQFYLVGWALGVTKNVIRRQTPELPEIEFSESLVRGLKSFVVSFVYSLPAFLIYLPILIVALLTDASNNPDSAGALVGVVSVCCSGLLVLYGLALTIWLPAATGNFIANGESIGAGLNFRQVWGLLRAAPGAYLMVLLGGFIAGVIAPLGTIACGVGVLLTSAYALVMVNHMAGQAYLQAKGM